MAAGVGGRDDEDKQGWRDEREQNMLYTCRKLSKNKLIKNSISYILEALVQIRLY